MADLTLPGGRLVGHFRRLGDDDEQAEGKEPLRPHLPLGDTGPELLYTAWEPLAVRPRRQGTRA